MKNVFNALNQSSPFGELVLDQNRCVVRVNRILSAQLGVPEGDFVGGSVIDLLPGIDLSRLCLPEPAHNSSSAVRSHDTSLMRAGPESCSSPDTGCVSAQVETLFSVKGEQGPLACFLCFDHPPESDPEAHDVHTTLLFHTVHDGDPYHLGFVLTLQRLQRIQNENQRLFNGLARANDQLMRSEKLAGIGQLAAGVAHEINNPMGYVFSNLKTLAGYMNDLIKIIDAIDQIDDIAALQSLKQTLEYDYIRSDVQALIDESEEGVHRVKKIIKALKDFSHNDDEGFRQADLHQGFETTLHIVHNEVKHKATVVKEYGVLPPVQCNVSQINQVFMNLMINASQAMTTLGTITVRTGTEGDLVWFEVEDTGQGMPPEVQARIFEPFFTTKPMGKGSGLGLSLSYTIIEKHHGHILIDSEVGKGTRIRVVLPVHQPEPATIAATGP